MQATKLIAVTLLAAALSGAAMGSMLTEEPSAASVKAAFDQFPLLKPKTNDAGEPVFQTLKFNQSVKVDGQEYYGFRFEVPARQKKEDFFWGFVEPGRLHGWSIASDKGVMDGTDNYFCGLTRANFEGTEHLFPVSAKQVAVQRLPGDRLEDGRTYLVLLMFNGPRPNQMSLKFCFADLGAKADKLPSIEKALALKRKQR